MTTWAEDYRQRRREAKAIEEANDPRLAKRRAQARAKHVRRKQRLAEQSAMEAAFTQALRERPKDVRRPSDRVVIPMGKVLVAELEQVLVALDRSTKDDG
jgi:hypothetical protein